MGILNFAHGAFFMVGAYVTAILLANASVPLPLFLLIGLIAGLVVGVIGLLSERFVFARLYNEGHVINLFASYAVMLILIGGAVWLWGTNIYFVQRPSELNGAVKVDLITVPTYNIFLIVVGFIVAVGIWALINKTTLGIQIRAVAHDRVTARALGVRAPLVGMSVFIIGGILAGFAGALAAPRVSVAPGLDAVFIIQCFVVVIVGGLGSIPGAMSAAILVGLVDSFLVTYLPEYAAYGMYILVAVVLLLRPQGLFSKAAIGH